jgi:hypothetical protein
MRHNALAREFFKPAVHGDDEEMCGEHAHVKALSGREPSSMFRGVHCCGNLEAANVRSEGDCMRRACG